VDWWALGVLIFELLSGHPPFEDPDPARLFAKIIAGIKHVKFTQRCKGYAGDLINNLMADKPYLRLPMRSGGVQNIVDHPWYTGGIRTWMAEEDEFTHSEENFDWEKFRKQQVKPPYVPRGKDVHKEEDKAWATKAALLRISQHNLPSQLPYEDDGSGWDAGFPTSCLIVYPSEKSQEVN